jgi:hypothetical protein
MTKKDYELIAKILAKAYSVHGGWSMSANEVIGQIDAEFQRQLKAENPRFNEDTFVDFILKEVRTLKEIL